MALIVEDGTGLATAEAYISLANANAYLEKFGLELSNTQATGTITLAAQVSDGDTVTIGSKTYTFQATLTDSDGNVAIGASLAVTQSNLVAAINLGSGAGTAYASSMTANSDVTAAAFASNVATLTAITGGTAGNAIALSVTMTSSSNVAGGTTLSGGLDDGDIALRKGARWLDAEYRYRGYKKLPTQALEFPRQGLYDESGYAISSSEVPTNIGYANALAAQKVKTGGLDLQADVTDPSTVESDTVKVGPITVASKYSGGKALGTMIFRDIEGLIQQFVFRGDEVVRS